MPSKSKKQRRFMAAAAHNPRFAKKAGIKQSVAKEFHEADQGALKKALGGMVRRPRNAGPMKSPDLTGVDAAIGETGEGLRQLVNRRRAPGRVARRGIVAARGGKIEKYKEGGKVSSGLGALRALAKKIQEALDSGDSELAKRLSRQMDAMEPGSSKAVTDEPQTTKKGREDKLATFAKGGKVKASRAVLAAARRRLKELEGKLAYGVQDKDGKIKGETPEQAAAREEYDRITDDIEKKYGVMLVHPDEE